MKIKDSMQYRIFTLFNYLIMAGIIIITLYPITHILFASVSESTELLKHSGLLLRPLNFTISAYHHVMQNPMVLNGYMNTIEILLLGLAINMVLTIMGAYVLSRTNLPGKNVMMFLVVFTMFFSGGMIPTYLTVQGYGLENTIWAMVLPGAVSTYNLIIMRTSFLSVPVSLEESAKLDGAGHFTIMVRIIVPLSIPVIAVVALYYSVSHWNAWFNAMLYLKDREKYPLQLILREILIQGDTSNMTQNMGDVDRNAMNESVKYAVMVVSTLPIMMVYPFIQKYFVKGVMIGAVKG